jgi:hypothetical protein
MTSNIHFPRQARGTTLIISIVLLLLLAMIGLFAATVGLREQQSSGAELRERIVRQAAEAGLSHAIEYMRGSSFVPAQPGGDINVAQWTPCAAADQTFPCGVVSPGVASDTLRRGRMYRFADGEDLNGDGTVDNRERFMVPLPTDTSGSRQIMTQVGNFPVEYGVSAVLCTFAADGSCTQTSDERTGLGTVTLASWAQIPGENTRITITESYGSFRILNVPPNAPPLVAGGLMQGVGNATVVANPNSGGPGVPVSLWSRGPLDPNNGSWQTCQLDDYMRQGPATYTGDTRVLTCVDCACVTDDRISGAHGQGAQPTIGIDVQTPLAGANARDNNGDGQPDYWSTDIRPSTYFPCDMFEYVFGVRAREDTNNNGTTNPNAPYPICEDGTDSNGDGAIDVAKEFLQNNAQRIEDCAALDATSAGLYWVARADGTPVDCDLGGDQIGSADDAVVIVSGGQVSLRGATVFGVIFGFNVKLVDLNEGNLDSYGPDLRPGGGKSQVYGAVMVEGSVKANGNIDIVASPKVIENFNNNRRNFRYGVVPGSWSDRVGY